ncbi:hypothetical protein MKW94_006455 [Papaver nudicaule]|uniref:Pentatricopeptide repeat-containing protein n=1 Tax=Papaver nudicaule TaxID=74823 RepID=A0AA42AZC8_PAPNU|nr:hypothetical protein [Papaver nudicaule]
MIGNIQQINFITLLGSATQSTLKIRVEPIKTQKEQKIPENPIEKRINRIYRKPQNRKVDDVVKVKANPILDNSSKNQNGIVKRKPVGNGKEKAAVEVSKIGNFSKEPTKYSAKWLSYGGRLPLILQALENGDDLDEALKPWVDSLNNKERSIILKEQTSWERAFEIFKWFKRKGCYELNVIHYNIMLRVLGKAQKWSLVESLWNEMVMRRIAPTNSTYGTLIDVYSKGGLTEKGLLWLEKMKKQGIEPDEVTMGIVVQTYKKAREFEKAEQFFKDWSSGKMVISGRKTTAARKSSFSQSNTCFSSYTFNTLIDTYGKAGNLQEASETFGRMLKEGIVPNTVTFNTMIHICGNNGHLGEVASLMQKMEQLRCPPDTRTYNILISLHTRHDDIYAAMSYFMQMKNVGLVPDPVSYRTLLYAFSIRQMVVESETLVSEMDALGLKIDEYTQSALTRMYIDAGMVERSWSWFERFHLKEEMSLECYSANIDAYGERGYVLEAEKAFICCKERKKLSVFEYNVMIKAYGIGKKYDKACELFDDMEKNGVLPDKCSYNSLVQILSGADLPYAARVYLRKMQQVGLVSDCVPYCAVISSFVKAGQLDLAEDILKEMVRFGVQPDVVVFGVLINAFADVGSVKKASEYVDAMRNAGLPGNQVIYNSLIKLYTKVGYLEEAKEMYDLLQSSESGPEAFSSNCMIDLYSERAMVTQAEKIFEDMKLRGDANEFSYVMMLCMYRKIGRLDEAIGIAQRMREMKLLTDLLSFNNVISLYASDGRLKEAVETFREMVNSSIQPDDYTFRSLGVVLVKCGVSKDAVSKLEIVRRNDSLSGLHAWVSTLCSIISIDDTRKSCSKAGLVDEFDPFAGNIMRYEVGQCCT